jgi:hypothetical protein
MTRCTTLTPIPSLRAIFLDANASKAGVDPLADYLALKTQRRRGTI